MIIPYNHIQLVPVMHYSYPYNISTYYTDYCTYIQSVISKSCVLCAIVVQFSSNIDNDVIQQMIPKCFPLLFTTTIAIPI